MSRYLTPSKIGLLALIVLYTDGVVPSSATIPVLSFLVSHVLPFRFTTIREQQETDLYGFTISIEQFQKATIMLASAIPGRTLWDLFLGKLWEIKSYDALHVFFDNLPLLLERSSNEDSEKRSTTLSRRKMHMLLSLNSPLGIFVRRAQLEFSRLQFHDGITLWKSLILLREPTFALWNKRNPSPEVNSFDCNLQKDAMPISGRLSWILYSELKMELFQGYNDSTDDMENLLEYQVSQMQNMGGRIPLEMTIKLREMIRSDSAVPNISYYVRFLDAWRSGDYPSAFDNLHRYFDYTMHSQDRALYQYALLNLAILQADFECFSEATIAMQETISTARENHDMPCLNYSLSWLYHFNRIHPNNATGIQKKGVSGTEREGLSFLKAKAKESHMWALLSTLLLSEAKLILDDGSSISQAFETVTKASHLNLSKHVPEAIGGQLMVQASIFDRLGVTCQAWVYGELFLHCYIRQSSSEDVLACHCRNAYLLARKGRFDDAITRMYAIEESFLQNLRNRNLWTASLGLLKSRGHLHSNKLAAGTYTLAQLQASPITDHELLFRISAMEIDLKVRRQDYSIALESLENLVKDLDQRQADISQQLTVMILKARIYDIAGIPQKGFSIALRAASLAYKARLIPILCEAVSAICKVLVSIKEFEAANSLLESVMPYVLECEDCVLTAYALSCLADIHMGMAGKPNAATLHRKEQLNKALEAINESFDEYAKVGDIHGQCEMMAKKATIMHLNGDSELANDCAAKYLDIRKSDKDNS